MPRSRAKPPIPSMESALCDGAALRSRGTRHATDPRRSRPHACRTRRGGRLLPPSGPRSLREFHRRQLAAAAQPRCRISTPSMPIAAGPTTWPTKRDPAESLGLLDWWEEELEACYAGRPRHPVFVALRGTIEEFSIPIEPFERLLDRVSSGPARHALRNPRRGAGLLSQLGQSGRAIGALPGPLPRRDSRRAGRFDLHRPATGELLSGRGPRLATGPRLPAGGRRWTARAIPK